jgi:ATP-dependent 26S proteasome regulatory subunit
MRAEQTVNSPLSAASHSLGESMQPDPSLDDNQTMGDFANQFRDTFLKLAARADARWLPLLAGDLVIAYVAITRGDNLTSDSDYPQSLHEMSNKFKILSEAKERHFGLKAEELDSCITRNVIHLLAENPKMQFESAYVTYLDSISRTKLNLADESDLQASYEKLYSEIIVWLKNMGVPFTLKDSIVIPCTQTVNLLRRFQGQPDFFLAPDIPHQKLANAALSLNLPDAVEVAALVDCTVFGSAKDAVVIGSTAIYYRNCGKDGFLPYSDFPDRTFTALSNADISLGRNLRLSLSGSSFSVSQTIKILDILKGEAIARETKSKGQSGLESLPGMQTLKKLLQDEVIEPLREPDKFRRYGINIPNGILMYGPPGCGKTFVAQRLAAELNYNFYEVSPSAVGSPYIHESCLKIKRLFDSAAASSPALMFVDEFEGLVPARSSLGGEQQYKAEEVNEWLVQIGSCTERKILFVAATNEPWSIDPAIRRSGRLDKKLYVGPPDREAIAEMLRFHLRDRFTSETMNIEEFASNIDGLGYSASDLKLLVDEASKMAMRKDAPISIQDFSKAAFEKVPPSISDEVQTRYSEFIGFGTSS